MCYYKIYTFRREEIWQFTYLPRSFVVPHVQGCLETMFECIISIKMGPLQKGLYFLLRCFQDLLFQ